MRRLIAGIAALVVIAVTVSLGNWQLRRADEKTEMQAVRDQALAAGALELAVGYGEGDELIGRNLRITGTFDDDRTVFIDNRTHNAIAGFHVVSPMHMNVAGIDRVVIVLRGWVPSDPHDRRRLPDVAGDGQPVSIEGLVEPGIPAGIRLGDWTPGGPRDRIWPHFDVEEFAAWSGLDPYSWVLRQTSDSGDGLVREWIRPGDSIDRHRAYALQWYSFAVLFAGLWAWYGFWAPRRRRRAGDPEDGDDDRDRPSGGDAP